MPELPAESAYDFLARLALDLRSNIASVDRQRLRELAEEIKPKTVPGECPTHGHRLKPWSVQRLVPVLICPVSDCPTVYERT